MAADGSIIIDTRMDTSGVQNGVSAIRQSCHGALAAGLAERTGRHCLPDVKSEFCLGDAVPH